MQHSDGFLKLVNETRLKITELGVKELKQMLDQHQEFVLIDVREESEWIHGHIPTAIHLSKGIIERDIEQCVADKTQKIVLYCGGGYRSTLAAMNVMKMGYCRVYSVWGGFRAWRESNFP